MIVSNQISLKGLGTVKPRTCLHCKTEFMPTNNRAKYCSITCKRRAVFVLSRMGSALNSRINCFVDTETEVVSKEVARRAHMIRSNGSRIIDQQSQWEHICEKWRVELVRHDAIVSPSTSAKEQCWSVIWKHGCMEVYIGPDQKHAEAIGGLFCHLYVAGIKCSLARDLASHYFGGNRAVLLEPTREKKECQTH